MDVTVAITILRNNILVIDYCGEKTKKVLFQTFKKIRSSQKPSWFDIHCGEKTKKVLFQTFKKIRSSQKPSWFNLFMRKNQEGFIADFQKNKNIPKTFLVYTSWWRKWEKTKKVLLQTYQKNKKLPKTFLV